MSQQTIEAFQDLLSTIQTKLNEIREENPLDIDRNQLPKSFGNNKNRNKKGNKHKGKSKGKKRKQSHYNYDNETIAKDTSQFKNSVNDFTNSTEKRKWFYEQFMKNYHNLPTHLQTKYNPPINDIDYNKKQVTDTNNIDYKEVLNKISSNPKLQKPTFRDICNQNPYYIHNRVTPPVLKKRKLNDSMDTTTTTTDTTTNLAVDLIDTCKQRQIVWNYYDQLTSYYYSRYLYYSSMIIQNHWNYIHREESKKRINNRQRIYMAEYSDPKELELHLSIKPPDNRIPEKYWYQRYRYFSKFDDGIQLDIESWYSVTPEKIANNIAEKCKCNVILDAMCGAGGNSIAFAKYCDLVIAIDIDYNKIKMAKHNAKIYGVENKIQFIVADFFQIAQTFINKGIIDIVFLSPPWGGQFYQQKQFDITYLSDDGKMNGIQLFKLAEQISPNIAYFLPKNTNYRQLQSLTSSGEKCNITKNYLYNKLKSITAYYGNLCQKNKSKQSNEHKDNTQNNDA